jgi:hypothetical protein
VADKRRLSRPVKVRDAATSRSFHISRSPPSSRRSGGFRAVGSGGGGGEEAPFVGEKYTVASREL